MRLRRCDGSQEELHHGYWIDVPHPARLVTSYYSITPLQPGHFELVDGLHGAKLTLSGNTYSIKNISEVEAELFFTQSRKITNSEQDETTIEQGSLAPQTIKKKKKVRRSPEEHEDKENEQGEEEDEDEDAEEQTPQARKKVKGRR